jgi:hypothetical protein
MMLHNVIGRRGCDFSPFKIEYPNLSKAHQKWSFIKFGRFIDWEDNNFLKELSLILVKGERDLSNNLCFVLAHSYIVVAVTGNPVHSETITSLLTENGVITLLVHA